MDLKKTLKKTLKNNMKTTQKNNQKNALIGAYKNQFRQYNQKTKFSLKYDPETGCLARKVTNRHYYVKGRGYAFDVAEIDKYKGVFKHLVIFTSSDRKFIIEHDEFWGKCKLINEAGKNQYLIQVDDLTVVQEQKTVQVRLSVDLHERVKEKALREGNTISRQLEICFNQNP